MDTTGITVLGDPGPDRQMLYDLSYLWADPTFGFKVLRLNLNAHRATTRPQMTDSVTLVMGEPVDTREMMS